MRRLALTVLLFAMGAATVAALMTWRQPAEVAGAAPMVSPKRTSLKPPPIPAPPPLPTHAATLPDLTFVLETTHSGPNGTRHTTQMITRSHDRVRLVLEGGQQEWLFVQNRVYRDRAAGYLTDHAAREIRFHDESPLRIQMRLRGWLDVLTLRFDPALLATLRDTGERQLAGGAAVARYVAADSSRDGVVEVWWSEALLLAMSLTVRDLGMRTTNIVKNLTVNADASLLADPPDRFPTYKSLDAVDADDR